MFVLLTLNVKTLIGILHNILHEFHGLRGILNHF